MENNELKEQDFYWEKYRWEFWRRNPEFRKAYDELQNYLNDDNHSYEDKGYMSLKITYAWGFYPVGGRFPNPYKTFEEEFEPEEVHKFFNKSYVSFVSDKTLSISIKLDEINSVHEIKNLMLSDIQKGLELMKKNKKRRPKAKKKVVFDVILMVGDLREEGLTYEQIAKKLFPRDFNINNENAKPESAIRKVGQYYQKYKDLVNDGYKDVTFP